MDFTLSHKTKAILFWAAIGLLLAGLIAWHYATAISVSAPSAPRLPGDTSSTEILDKTIVNLDVDEEAKIDASKLNVGGANFVPFGMPDGVATSTGFRFATSTDPSLAIGTTTPGTKGLQVQGGAIITGDLVAGSIKATGTLNVGGQPLSFPTNTGSNGNILKTNGAGTLSWGAAGDWNSCGYAALAAATTTIILDDIPNRQFYRLHFWIAGKDVGGGAPGIIFNGDTGANYGTVLSDNAGAVTAASGASLIQFDQTGNIKKKYFVFDIAATSTMPKIVTYHGYVETADTTSGTMTEGGAHWANSTEPINTIIGKMSGAANYNAGTAMQLFCSTF